ncbi:glycosyltransferase family 2 protein [Dinoroseobacter sp. S76]|uniref:glycosyltransferase family 2 protein n=1 Tax=Dinoroseobacter sp. S76 TaxID=3415124 RepID=UPI003C7ABBDE
MDTSSLDAVDICHRPDVEAPEVSVVIPAYNRAATIEVAIRSVLGQTYDNLEVIIVDDGSDDETVAVAMGLDDPRIGVLRHRSNAGPSGARNTGILAASAPLVAFQDSDDIWLPEKLSRQVPCLSDPSVVASYCGMIITGDLAGPDPVLRLAPAGGYASGEITEALLQRSLISTQTLIARRDVLLDLGLFDLSFRALEDWELALRLSQVGQILPVPDALVVQRFSDNSLTHARANWAWAHRDILRKHETLLRAHPQAGALQWGIVAGRFRAIGEPQEARAAARMALKLGGMRPRAVLQYIRAHLAS